MIDALISGKLIRDPTVKTGPSGKAYCNILFSVFTGDEAPVIVSGIAFTEVAVRIGRLAKGDVLTVTGALKPSQWWADRATGEIKHGLNVTVSACLSAYDLKKRRPHTDEPETNAPPRQPWSVTKPEARPPPETDQSARDDEPPPFDDPVDF